MACPSLSENYASTFIECNLVAFLSEISVKIEPDKLAASVMNKDAMVLEMEDDRTNFLTLIGKYMRNKKSPTIDTIKEYI